MIMFKVEADIANNSYMTIRFSQEKKKVTKFQISFYAFAQTTNKYYKIFFKD